MKISLILVPVFLPLLMVFASGCTHNSLSQPGPTLGPDITSLRDAVDIAVSALHGQSHYPANDYILTSAQQIIVDGKYVWRITFKPVSLLPKDPSKGLIGAGGEIFVKVDLSTKKTEFTYGE
jgi:hypothetical protein